MRYVNLIYLFR